MAVIARLDGIGVGALSRRSDVCACSLDSLRCVLRVGRRDGEVITGGIAAGREICKAACCIFVVAQRTAELNGLSSKPAVGAGLGGVQVRLIGPSSQLRITELSGRSGNSQWINSLEDRHSRMGTHLSLRHDKSYAKTKLSMMKVAMWTVSEASACCSL